MNESLRAATFVLLLIGVISLPLATVFGRQRTLMRKEPPELAGQGKSERRGISEILFKERDDSRLRLAGLFVVGVGLVVVGVWAPPSFVPSDPIGDVDWGRTMRLVFIVGGVGNIALGGVRFVVARRRRS